MKQTALRRSTSDDESPAGDRISGGGAASAPPTSTGPLAKVLSVCIGLAGLTGLGLALEKPDRPKAVSVADETSWLAPSRPPDAPSRPAQTRQSDVQPSAKPSASGHTETSAAQDSVVQAAAFAPVFATSPASSTLGESPTAGESPPPLEVPPDGTDGTPDPPKQPAPGVTPDGKVILNTASAQELTRLPGIGIKRADKIVELRERLGRFKRPEDLLRVRGIGVKSLRKMLPHLVLDPPDPA